MSAIETVVAPTFERGLDSVRRRLSFEFMAAALFLILLISIDARLILDNTEFFRRDYVQTGDFAATSIGTYDAEHLRQVRGQASFNGYYHPGPAVMYYRAIFDAPARLLGWREPPAPALISQVVLVTAVLIFLFLALRASLGGTSGDLYLVTLAVFVFFQIKRPSFLVSLWEPQVGGLVFLCFLVAGAAVINSRNVRWLVLTVLLGGFAVQSQLTLAFPVLLFYLVVGFFYFGGIREKTRELPLLGAVAVFAYLPEIIDLAFYKAKNLRLILDYADVSRGRPAQTTAAAWRIFADNLNLASEVRWGVLLLLIAIGLAVAFQPSAKKWAEGVRGPLFLAALALLGLVCAFVAQRYLTDQDYSPPHVSAYAYLMAALLVGLLLMILASALGVSPRLASLFGLLLMVVTIVVALTGPAFRYASDSPENGFRAPKILDLVSEVRSAKSADPGFTAEIAIDARRSNWIYGWRTAVGFANLLRRSGVPYCLPRSDDSGANYDVMEIYMKTSRCQDSHPERVIRFACTGATSFGYIYRGETTRLWSC